MSLPPSSSQRIQRTRSTISRTPSVSSRRSEAEDPEVIVRCDIARKGGKLDLSGFSIQQISHSMLDLGNFLKVCWLHENSLTTLPEEISSWSLVSQLRLSNNALTGLPSSIGKLKHLSMLFVDHNRLRSLPEEICECKQLSHLNFQYNRVERIPIDVISLSKMHEFLYENNPLVFPHKSVANKGYTAIIKYFKRFSNANKTGKLDLNHCDLDHIPLEVQYCAEKLTILDLADFCPSSGISLPCELSRCKHITNIRFHPEAKHVFPPQTVMQQGVGALLAYLSQFMEGKANNTVNLSKFGLRSFPSELLGNPLLKGYLFSRVVLDENLLQNLPDAIANLATLQELHVRENKLESIPATMAFLTQLKVLDLSGNELKQVNRSFPVIQSLERLILSRNKIETFENFGGGEELAVIDASDNQIQRFPVELSQSSKLSTLLLQSNNISTLPSEIRFFTKLKVLDLAHNGIKEIPDEIGDISCLESLRLDQNAFHSLPTTIGQLKNLKELTLMGCTKLRIIPPVLGNISHFQAPLRYGRPALETLALDSHFLLSPPAEIIAKGIEEIFFFLNLISHAHQDLSLAYVSQGLLAFPLNMFEMPWLRELDLTDNLISEFPEEMKILTSLEKLVLQTNKLESVHESIKFLTKLTLLNVKDNPLQTLPVELGFLSALKSLELGYPGPATTIPPSEIARKGGAAVLDYLRRIVQSKSSCRLEMQRLGLIAVPSEIAGFCSQPYKVSFAHNHISTISSEIGLFENAQTLCFNDNKLESIACELRNLTRLVRLDLEGNLFETMPNILTSLTSLTVLNLSRNQLSDCPVHLCKLTLLEELILDHNKISVLPNKIGNCGALRHFSISHNALRSLPASIKDFKRLLNFDLSHNHLTILPAEVGMLPLLEYIEVSGNPIESPPPEFLSKGTYTISLYLRRIREMKETGYLTLNNSKLTNIPRDVLSYDAVKSLDLSHNEIAELPTEIGNLRFLVTLDLNVNLLHSLPDSIGHCFSLCDLYLTRNKLTSLPMAIHKLTNLTTLELDLDVVTNPPSVVCMKGGKECVRYFNAINEAFAKGIARLQNFDLLEIPSLCFEINMQEMHLGGNQLSSLPASVVLFTSLRVLNLNDNLKLRDLPKVMRTMLTLTEFSMAGNEIKSLPEELFRLTNLMKLDLSRNELDGIGNILGNLSRLTYLDLSSNRLWNLPWPALVKLKVLKTLKLGKNPLTNLSANISELSALEEVDLSETRVTMLPTEFLELETLKVINLTDTEILGPSPAVTEQGLPAILEFLRHIRAARGTSSLNLIGFSCAGGRQTGLEPYSLETILQSLTIQRSSVESFPSDFLALSKLVNMDISENHLKLFPEKFGASFPFLVTLAAGKNRIQELNSSFGSLTRLSALLLPDNMLTTIVKELGGCVNLSHIDLIGNQVTYLPAELGKLRSLARVDLEYNFLTVLRSLKMNWKDYGPPPTEILVQGTKTIRTFYDKLSTSAEASQNVSSVAIMPSLNLKGHGFLNVPSILFDGHMFENLGALNLSHNNLISLDPRISKLTSLQVLNLKGCKLDRIPISLGVIKLKTLKMNFDLLQNIPYIFLKHAETGVLNYLEKVYLEATVGCIDFSNLNMATLPKDLSDFSSITQLYLTNNVIHQLPKSISCLTNLKSLNVDNNRLSSLSRHLGALTSLTSLHIRGNRIQIMSPEIYKMTSLTNLEFDFNSISPLPLELQDRNAEVLLSFLAQIYHARGKVNEVSPLPGLKHGDSWEMFIEGVPYTVTIPPDLDIESLERFKFYTPVLDRNTRQELIDKDFECLKKNDVGLELNLSNLALIDWSLLAVPAKVLNDLQVAIFEDIVKRENDAHRKVEVEGRREPMEVATDRKNNAIEASNFTITDEGVVKASAEKVSRAGWLTGLFDLKRKKSYRDLPCSIIVEEDDLIATWVAEKALNRAYPLPICSTTNLTTLRLDNNKLSCIASSIGTLSNLTALSCRNNKLESVSWRLRYLYFLRELDLKNNLLTSLPPKIGRCDRLEKLVLSRNFIHKLPISIGRLSRLTALDISENPIEYLPHEIGGMDNEEFQDMVGLRSIKVIKAKRCSSLLYLPSKLYRLTTLRELDLVETSNLKTPPQEILAQGFDVLFKYMYQQYVSESALKWETVSFGLQRMPSSIFEMNKSLSESHGKDEGMPWLKEIDLSNNYIGTISRQITLLRDLRVLNLERNQISKVSKSLSYLTRLGRINLSSNFLTTVGKEFGTLAALKFLSLDYNQIEFMDESCANLRSLMHLSLMSNMLKTFPEVIISLVNLQFLNLSSNQIGKIPNTIGRLQSLEIFLMQNNALDSIPESIGQLKSLQELDLSDNNIQLLPLSIGSISGLKKLDTRRNGCIRPPKGTQEKGPQAVVEYLKRVENASLRKLLDVENFGLSSFPLDTLAMQDLTELNLSANSISALPREIVVLTRLVTFRYSSNNLLTLPSIVCKLTTLTSLDLQENKLNSLPSNFSELPLMSINLSRNNFEIFPPPLERMTNLEHIDLTDNRLTRLPFMIGRFVYATAILLGGNQVSVLPDSLGAMGEASLQVINLSKNGLFDLPSALFNIKRLERICLSGNNLRELPNQLCVLKKLKELWLDHNQLTYLPSRLGELVSLSALYLHSNRLKMIPKNLVELKGLKVLTLSGNELRELPWDFHRLSELEELWLDDNQFEALQLERSLFPRLQFLTFRHNPLTKEVFKRLKENFEGLDKNHDEENQAEDEENQADDE